MISNERDYKLHWADGISEDANYGPIQDKELEDS